MKTFQQQFLLNLQRLADDKSSFLLAISGGVDSMVMLDLFTSASLNFSVAHVNFQLRGADADADEALVHSVTVNSKQHCYSKKFNTREYATENHLSIQVAARNLRYEWFHSLMEEYKLDYLVTAHHANDQSETMLMNIIRGKSITALAGIPEKNNRIIRPLLPFPKSELINYARENKLVWREDVSNSTTDYERNFIRLKIMPLLETLNPSVDLSMSFSGKLLAEANALIESTYAEWKLKHCIIENETVKVTAIDALQKSPVMQNFIYKLLTPYNFASAVVRHLASNMQLPPGSRFLSPTHTLLIDRNCWYIVASDRSPSPDEYQITSPSFFETERFTLEFEKVSHPDFSATPEIAYLDGDSLAFPLLLRKWQEGDSFMPLGMDHHKKLSDFFIDQKIPVHEKESCWLLLSEGKVVWVIGHRIDHRFRINPHTTNVIKITFAVL